MVGDDPIEATQNWNGDTTQHAPDPADLRVWVSVTGIALVNTPPTVHVLTRQSARFALKSSRVDTDPDNIPSVPQTLC